MKSLRVFLVFISFYAFAKAQNTQPIKSLDPVEYSLGVGEHEIINDIEVIFLEVLEDSRCPKDVDCVWSGEAKIKVRIKEKGKDPIEKTIVLGASRKAAFLYTSETIKIKAIKLTPYPESTKAAKDRVYHLEISGQEI